MAATADGTASHEIKDKEPAAIDQILIGGDDQELATKRPRGKEADWDLETTPLCYIDLEPLEHTQTQMERSRTEKYKRNGRALCGVAVAVNSAGIVNWLTGRDMHCIGKCILGPESTEEDGGNGVVVQVEQEGIVRKVAFGHRTTQVVVCYVEFPSVGCHKLMHVDEVVERGKKRDAKLREGRRSRKK